MYWLQVAAGASLLATAQAHVTNWDKGMFGLNWPNQATDKDQNYNANAQVNPLREMDALTEDQWFGHGYKAFPPAPGDFMELPSGGVYMGSLTCNRAMSRMRNPTYTKPLPEFSCDSAGPLHTTNRFDKPVDIRALGGTAIGIAYTSDINSVKPNDMTIISVNHASPWKRETAYPIPAGMPPCPEGGCICSWNWLHRGPSNGGEGYGNEIYNTLYRCKVTGNTNSNNVVQRGAIPKDCTGRPANCVKGPKTGLYLYQRDGNNVARPGPNENPPSYSNDWGFANGAQNDIYTKSATPAGEAAIVNPYATGTASQKFEDPKPTTTAVPAGWKAIGCTVDTKGDRFLTDRVYIDDDNTITMCVSRCDQLGYGSAGVQNKECWCGNTDVPVEKAPESECNRRCPGDQWAYCGAAYRNTLYQKQGGSTGTSPIPEPWRFIGCHMEPTGKRGINGGVVAMQNLTPSRCAQFCGERKFKYAGVQYGTQCYCGNTYKPNQVTGCNTPCGGDKKQKCGGEYRNMVYTTETLARRDDGAEDVEEKGQEGADELDSQGQTSFALDLEQVPRLHKHAARSRVRFWHYVSLDIV